MPALASHLVILGGPCAAVFLHSLSGVKKKFVLTAFVMVMSAIVTVIIIMLGRIVAIEIIGIAKVRIIENITRMAIISLSILNVVLVII